MVGIDVKMLCQNVSVQGDLPNFLHIRDLRPWEPPAQRGESIRPNFPVLDHARALRPAAADHSVRRRGRPTVYQ